MLNALLDCAKARGAPPVTASVSATATSKVDSTEHSRDGASGTGFLVTRQGHIITNAHVVAGCGVVKVPELGNAKVIATDKKNDLALLTVSPPANVEPLRFRDKPIRLGEEVIALGFPLKGLLGGLNVTTGMVSAMSGLQNDTSRIQFTAPIQPGNSGGALLDKSGAVTGVISAKLNDLTTLKVAGFVPQAVNFAIRKDVAKAFLEAQNVALEAAPAGSEKSVADTVDATRAAVLPIECGK
jgi:S1-C subfamily serine protease